MPGGRVIDPREEKIPYGLFSILTPRCPKPHFLTLEESSTMN
tara:strand:- start:391 stop:516 length:126 start_codon:yes stop_codon:yes gene_type:complete